MVPFVNHYSVFIRGLITQFIRLEVEPKWSHKFIHEKIFDLYWPKIIMLNKTKCLSLLLPKSCYFFHHFFSCFYSCLNSKVCFDRMLTQVIAYLFYCCLCNTDASGILLFNWYWKIDLNIQRLNYKASDYTAHNFKSYG